MRLLSLFSGCGGLDLGMQGDFVFLKKRFSRNPFDVVFANDVDPAACDTYDKNFKHKITRGDIVKILKKQPELLPDCDIIIGGFPCQDFSLSGKRKGFRTKRGRLYEQMKQVIEMKRPAAFIAENVYGLVLLGALEPIKNDLASAGEGYNVTHHIVTAADYGVPQMRRRVFIVGIRKDIDAEFKRPPATHAENPGRGQRAWISTKDALGDLMGKKEEISNHNEYSKARFYAKRWQGTEKIKADLPGPTIRAYHHGNIQFHYKENRRLTVRECARIQAFPDNFIFTSNPSRNYISVGNAVPPVLGWHFARALSSTLRRADLSAAKS